MSDASEQLDFSGALRRAMATPETSEKLAELQAISRTRLDYLQTIQFDRALAQLDIDFGFPVAKVAILSSPTADHIRPALAVAGIRYGVQVETYLAPFGQYRQELVNPESGLWRFRPDTILFALSGRDAISTTDPGMAQAKIDERLRQYVGDLKELWQSAAHTPGTMIIQQTVINTTEPLFGSLDRVVPGSPSNVIRQLNQRIVDSAAEANVVILDMDYATRRNGIDYWFDRAKWLQAKIEIPPAAALDYADLVARLIAAGRGLSKKCLVLDLDNTLWGGVVGDDGIENLALGEGSGTGEAFLAFQRYVKQLMHRGVILAVCSKNEQSVAEAVFRDHPEMLLSLDDISCFIANWDDKATNLKRISEQLNIGIDSLVFVDDNPAERALVRSILPAVAVPELPQDPAAYLDCLANAGYFESLAFTPEDLQRSQQYASNAKRNSLRSSSHSLDDYLAELDMKMTIGSFATMDLPRICQLIGKTNQFNTTTHRRTLDEIREIVSDEGYVTLQVRLTDRFGDNGLVSALILRPDDELADSLLIDSWVMSCRVFGRQLEIAIMNHLVDNLRHRKIRLLSAIYRATPKNKVIENLFRELGFELAADESEVDQAQTRWKLDIADYKSRPTHISLSENDRG